MAVPGAQSSAEADAGASTPAATATTSTAAARDDLEELCFVPATVSADSEAIISKFSTRGKPCLAVQAVFSYTLEIGDMIGP
ncbi:MAG: hypothetical protein ABW135_02715 [Thermoleophilaceae bacterium]